MKLKPTPEQVQAITRLAGYLGHTHFALTRNVEGKLRIDSETCSVADAKRLSPDAECILTRVGKNRYLRRVA